MESAVIEAVPQKQTEQDNSPALGADEIQMLAGGQCLVNNY